MPHLRHTCRARLKKLVFEFLPDSLAKAGAAFFSFCLSKKYRVDFSNIANVATPKPFLAMTDNYPSHCNT